MKSCNFSETQFSFCFTFEYIKLFFPNIPLPFFPNTVKEGRAGGGYDVKINGNIYFQFKIPVYGYKGCKDWNVFKHDYYKIKVETNEEQFKLLKALQCPANEVYYATPEFHTAADLFTHYRSSNIASHSAIFPIDNFPEYGNEHHHLIYSPNESWGALFSEPMNVKKVKSINPFKLFPETTSNLTIYEQARKIRNIIRKGEYQICEERSLNDDKREQFVQDIYAILLTRFNIHWYPVISSQQWRPFNI